MRSKLLLPNRFKWIGILLFIPFLVLGILSRYKEFQIDALTSYNHDNDIFTPVQNFTDELALSGLILSLLMIAFAREKQEDEFIYHNRLESWEWAVLINFLLLIVACWVFYNEAFIDVMMYNLLTPLIIFIVRFHWVMLRNKPSEEKN
ncbi:MAG TPA: hypothetical protein VEV87_10100 [Chitinophagaceae bacterium]|nr:hypothetical protein [Chitinophagaceae bacterium]